MKRKLDDEGGGGREGEGGGGKNKDALSEEILRKVSRSCATVTEGAQVICLDDKDDEETVKLIIESKTQKRPGNEKSRTLEDLANTTRDFTEEDYETLLKLDEDNKVPSLSADEINAIPYKYLNKCDILSVNRSGVNNTCCICCNKFVNGDYVRVLPGCGHFFHTFCIDPWLSTSVFCPVDRMNIQEELNKRNEEKENSKKNEDTKEEDEKSNDKDKKIEIIEID